MTTALRLTHIDPERNMARFYTMTIQPNLFGEWTLMREWGRVGRGGQVQESAFLSCREAEACLARLKRQKERKGYLLQ